MFLRNFHDDERRVNTNNSWVWIVHGISYFIVLYIYLFTEAAENDTSESRRIWIPLDCILTFCIACYQVISNFVQFMAENEVIDAMVEHRQQLKEMQSSNSTLNLPLMSPEMKTA